MALFFVIGLNASGQPVKDWLDKQLTSAATMLAAQKKPAQAQSTSLSHGSTTFVDQTAATDLLSTALNLTPLGGSEGGSGTVTASLYSVFTLASGEDPLKPSVYNAHSNMRTLFATIGREEPGSGTQSSAPPGTILGARWLPVNQRDASAIAKDKKVRSEFTSLASAIGGATSQAASELSNLLFSHRPDSSQSISAFLGSLKSEDDVQAMVDRLAPEDKAQVTALIARFRGRMSQADSALQKLVGTLSRRWQVALDFQSTQRSAGANNDYQAEFVADRAVNDRLFFTFNASYLYSDSSKVGADTRNGRGAFELQYSLTHAGAASLRSPVQLSLSGEGIWKQQQWQYHAQVQLSIPISTGINLPFSMGYGNRTDLLSQQQKDVYGKFGLTLDLAKVVGSIKTAQ